MGIPLLAGRGFDPTDPGKRLDQVVVSTGMVKRMFEPFACKHTDGHNSGMELFAMREIVHAHEGEVTVTSTAGEGTVFQLYFPGCD